MKFNIEIPKDILTISEIFKANGFKLFLVGGCVRDALLEIKPKDFDLVTDALPDTVIDILKQEKIVKNILETGKNFGVINVITDNDEYEIATFRSDGNYTDGRRPDGIEFSSIEEDVLRRDLTINALYYDIDNKDVIDMVDGIEDLYKKTIRTVGRARDRFTEDRLRVLRAIRFATRFESKMDEEIEDEIFRDYDISKVSPERIRDEFIKIIKTSSITNEAIDELNSFLLLNQILPFRFLNTNIDFKNSKNHILVISLLLDTFWDDISKIKKVLNEAKYTKNEIHNIVLVVKLVNILNTKLGFINFDDLFVFVKEFKNGNPNIELFKEIFDIMEFNTTILNNLLDFEFSVTGEDVMRDFDIQPGPSLGLKIRELEIDNLKAIF